MQEFENPDGRGVPLHRTLDGHPDVADQLPIRDGHGDHLCGQVHRTQPRHHGDADSGRDKLHGGGVIGGLDGEIGGETCCGAGIEQDLPTGPAVEVRRAPGGDHVVRGYNLALNAGERLVDAGTAALVINLAPLIIAFGAG